MKKKTRRSGQQLKTRAPIIALESNSRVQRSKTTVLCVTTELLTENGLGGVSVDEVSRRSGVAKTTIYRHWPTRSDLLMDACSQMGTDQEIPNTGNLKGDLTALLRNLAGLLRSAKWSSVLPSVIDSAERDTGIAKVHSALQMKHAAPFREVILRYIGKGEISKNIDPATLIAALVGPLFYRRWFSRESIDDKFVQTIIGNAIGNQTI